MPAEHPGHGTGRQLSVVLPVIQAVVVGQRHIHVRRVGDHLAVHPGTLPYRMRQTGIVALLFRLLIQASQQQGKEGHVIAQSQAAGGRRLLPDPAADAAVAGGIAPFFLRGQLIHACRDQSEHKYRLLFAILSQNSEPLVNKLQNFQKTISAARMPAAGSGRRRRTGWKCRNTAKALPPPRYTPSRRC